MLSLARRTTSVGRCWLSMPTDERVHRWNSSGEREGSAESKATVRKHSWAGESQPIDEGASGTKPRWPPFPAVFDSRRGMISFFLINGEFPVAAEGCRAQAIGCDRGRGVCRPLPGHRLPGWVIGEDGLLRGLILSHPSRSLVFATSHTPLVPLAHSFAKIPDMFTKSRATAATLSLLPLLAALVPGVASQSW